MGVLVFTLLKAFWLGIMTSISPCPMAGNIAAMSYIARTVSDPKYVLRVAVLYTIGRTAVYVTLGALLSGAFLTVPGVSNWLQIYMNRMMGPIMIVTGVILLDLLPFTPKGKGVTEKFQKKIEQYGLLGALALGAFFALAFCPVSAALFFGGLIPLSLETKSMLLCPIAYGVGTAIPVVLSGVFLGLGLNRLGCFFERVRMFDRWARYATGGVFAVVGVWFTLKYTLMII